MPLVDSLLATHAPWAAATGTWPLTPLELFMWLDDRPRYSLMFRIDIRFEGPIDVAAMRDAFRFALGRHPLLRATIVRDARGVHWHAPAAGWNELEFVPRAQGSESDVGWVDLAAGPGLRGCIRETADGSDVTLFFHHACCDGQGARMFIQDLSLAYAVLRGVTNEDTIPTLDVALLDRRGSPVVPPTTWGGVRFFANMFRTRPQPAAGDAVPPAAPGAEGSAVGYCSHTFDRDHTLRLQDPRRLGATSFNDVAVALLFRVLDDWQRGRGVSPGTRMRISVPVDLRGREHERMPAANRYTYVFVNRRIGAGRDWSELLADTQNQLRSPPRPGAGNDLLSGLSLSARWPRLMHGGLRLRRCFATAVLTNLSDPSRRLRKRLPVDDEGCIWLDRARCHDIQLRTPPLRPRTNWGVGVFKYAGRVTLTFRYDTTVLSAAAAQGVLAAYIDGWQRWMEETPVVTGDA